MKPRNKDKKIKVQLMEDINQLTVDLLSNIDDIHELPKTTAKDMISAMQKLSKVFHSIMYHMELDENKEYYVLRNEKESEEILKVLVDFYNENKDEKANKIMML